MIKGTKVQATNSAAIGAYSGGQKSAVPLMTLAAGTTFILTDMVVGFTPSHTVTGTAGVVPGISLQDIAGGGNTAGDMDNAKYTIRVNPGDVFAFTAGSNAIVHNVGPLVMTNIENGPEFSTCVSAICIGTWPVPTYGLWVGGILR